jgi:hypothetical protein
MNPLRRDIDMTAKAQFGADLVVPIRSGLAS